MIFDANEFVFEPPAQVGRARRILIKPSAGYALPYPITTSREILEIIIEGIRRVSEADIILLEGSPQEESMHLLYRTLGYDFPRVLTLDVKECVLVEVENPLARPYALPTFWIPNVVLFCDFLMSVAPMKVSGGQGSFSIMNVLSLLPVSKYRGNLEYGWGALYDLGIGKVIADLYFTLPFDLAVIDARAKFLSSDSPTEGRIEAFGKIFCGDPYEVDCEASQSLGLVTEYLQLIEAAKTQLDPRLFPGR